MEIWSRVTVGSGARNLLGRQHGLDQPHQLTLVANSIFPPPMEL